ncbi:hypothetical protein B7C42_08264 [Nocardia cerradoensis]|uniref:DarT domain-containing protein n=2 Tax=Nocardia cerradoensis TaxID=85688 RepID=A0A231GSV8_9NOCA|nr:hypothetical protein B7C42_08264 [Nocardia cerradoensis]
MLYAIHKGNVAGHGPDCSRIVYLSTTVGELRRRGLAVLGTDRHALMDYAHFTDDDAELTTYVDWPLMRRRIWRSEADDPDRGERRQAELLVHRHVPWDSIAFIAAKTAATVAEVQAMVESARVSTRLLVRPDWYF